jgi:FkbM family methyltransferase
MFNFLRIFSRTIIYSNGTTPSWCRKLWMRRFAKRLFRLRKRLAREVVIRDQGSQYRFRCESLTEFIRALSLLSREPGTLAWIRSEVGPGDVFYDIGANIGVYSIVAAERVGEAGKVIAFEPHGPNFVRLLENIALNGLEDRVVPCNFALHGEEGFLPFAYVSTETGSSGSQFGSPAHSQEQERKTKLVELKYGETLDHLLASGKFPTPTHVKIDVDGNEYLILRGMGQLLGSTTRPRSIQVEINPHEKAQILSLMTEHGYALEDMHYSEFGAELIARTGNSESHPANGIFKPLAHKGGEK